MRLTVELLGDGIGTNLKFSAASLFADGGAGFNFCGLEPKK